MQQFSDIRPKTNFKISSNFSDKDENLEISFSDWDFTFSEQNGRTQVSITITNDSLERMEKMIGMGFKEGFSMYLQQLDELLSTTNE